ncbi:hypothetical protein [Chamaesiphon sp. VAR_48_metabat_403]|nr:hypothetical protein [Chamaesiphon sp. VAR_48_metabat_403]
MAWLNLQDVFVSMLKSAESDDLDLGSVLLIQPAASTKQDLWILNIF